MYLYECAVCMDRSGSIVCTVQMSSSITGNDSVGKSDFDLSPTLLQMQHLNWYQKMENGLHCGIDRKSKVANCVMTTVNKIIFNKYYNNPQADIDVHCKCTLLIESMEMRFWHRSINTISIFQSK